MKNNKVYSVMLSLIMLVSVFSVAAVSPFNNGWQGQIGNKAGLSKFDFNCNKGMIWGRLSTGVETCVWPGNNKDGGKSNGLVGNIVGSGSGSSDIEGSGNDGGGADEEEGGVDEDGGGSDEEQEEGEEGSCEVVNVCEWKKVKVWKDVCGWKHGRWKCSWDWVWDYKRFCQDKLIC